MTATPHDDRAPSLADFLLARIAEDEAVAQEATPGPWRDCPMGSEGSDVQAGGHTITTARRPARCREFGDATHIARHDPARVLAECEAKRELVTGWAAFLHGAPGWAEEEMPSMLEMARRTLHLLALSYADHDEYDERWKP